MSMQPRVETIPREQPSRSQRIDELVQAAGQDGATEVIARLRSTIAVLCELLVELQQAAIGIESERTGDVTPARRGLSPLAESHLESARDVLVERIVLSPASDRC